MRYIARFLRRKVGVGRASAPLWLVLASGAVLAVAAGQAVGPVLAGGVQGSIGATVEQTLRLKEGGSTGNTVTTPDDFAITVNDEGTGFTVAIETETGQNQTLKLVLQNESGKTVNGKLSLVVPAGIDVDVESADDVETLARLNADSWLFTHSATTTDDSVDITIEIESKDDAAPGFYMISGKLIQVSH